MRALKTYIAEAARKTTKKPAKPAVDEFETERREIANWINANYWVIDNYVRVSKKPNRQGLFEVSISGKDEISARGHITKLTNGKFTFKKAYRFVCMGCASLESLEGAPKEVNTFDCTGCLKITSLEGCPQIANANFICNNCPSLLSLEGAPKEVEYFDCNGCTSLKDLEGAPEKVGEFHCSGCNGLTDLKGSPKTVGEYICINTNVKSFKGISDNIGFLKICKSNNVKDLSGLENTVVKSLKLEDLENLESLNGLNPDGFKNTRITEGGYSGGCISIVRCPKFTSIEPLEYIGGVLELRDCKSVTLDTVKTLKSVNRIDFYDMPYFYDMKRLEVLQQLKDGGMKINGVMLGRLFK